MDEKYCSFESNGLDRLFLKDIFYEDLSLTMYSRFDMRSNQFKELSVTTLFGRSVDECESKIEEVFLWEFSKVVSENVTIERQQECDVGFTSYWLDFYLVDEINGHKIAVECDGKKFHSVERDSKRDAAILRTDIVSEIVRIPGKDIWFRMHDVFQMISQKASWLFSSRGITNTNTLAARDHLCEDDWMKSNNGVYQEQTRHYKLPDEETELYYESGKWEYLPTKLLWACCR